MVKSCVPEMEEQSEGDREEFGAVPREHRANQELLKNMLCRCGGHFVFIFAIFFIDLPSVCVSALDYDSFFIAKAVIANCVLTSHFFLSSLLFGDLLGFGVESKWASSDG